MLSLAINSCWQLGQVSLDPLSRLLNKLSLAGRAQKTHTYKQNELGVYLEGPFSSAYMYSIQSWLLLRNELGRGGVSGRIITVAKLGSSF